MLHPTVDRTTTHRPTARTAWAAVSAVGAAGGVVLATSDVALGLPVVVVALLSLALALAAMDEARTLRRLDGVSLEALAVPLPVLPTASARPHRDVAALPHGLPAVVALPDGGWGLVPPDVAEAVLGRPGFDGRWHRVAEPMPLHDGRTSAGRIGRVPRERSAVLVDRDGQAPHGVTGAALRAAAADGAVAVAS